MTLAQTEKPEVAESKAVTDISRYDLLVGPIIPGGRLLHLPLLTFNPARVVVGFAKITQAIYPPPDLAFKVEGTYTYMAVMHGATHVLVVLKGYKLRKGPENVGAIPFVPEAIEVRMVLNEKWNSGVANYRYIDEQGVWQEVENAPVTLDK